MVLHNRVWESSSTPGFFFPEKSYASSPHLREHPPFRRFQFNKSCPTYRGEAQSAVEKVCADWNRTRLGIARALDRVVNS